MEEPYSDADALSEYFSLGRRHYFIDSDFENYNEPGEVLANTNDIFHEELDNLIELSRKFRGSLGEMKGEDMEREKE